MPELPDVEVFKRYLDATGLHKTISTVQAPESRVLKGVTEKRLKTVLKGTELSSTKRHGKHLLVSIKNADHLLALHFGMTGFLKYYKDPDDDPGHVRLRLDFDNGYHLAFDCQRMLGAVKLITDEDSFLKDKGLGPDALDERLDFDTFKDRITGKKGAVKSTLMNQKFIAGIGNVYSDEILFQARIDPNRKVDTLSEDELKTVFQKIRTVLETAINHQADPSKFPKTYITGHRKSGEPCPGCKGTVKKETIGGRSSYYCPSCQQ